MFKTKKKLVELEKKIADLEGRVQSQQSGCIDGSRITMGTIDANNIQVRI